MSLPENRQRLQMGVFPEGAQIVPNVYNKIPGFFIRDHTFMPGFPEMAWPMMEWTLDTRYADRQHNAIRVEHSFLAFKLPESRITPADRKSVVSGKSVSVRVDIGGRRRIKKKKKEENIKY